MKSTYPINLLKDDRFYKKSNARFSLKKVCNQLMLPKEIMSPLETASQWCNRTSWRQLQWIRMSGKVLYCSHVLHLSVGRALIFEQLAPRAEDCEPAEDGSCSSVDVEADKALGQAKSLCCFLSFFWKTIYFLFIGPVLGFYPLSPLCFRCLHKSAGTNFEHKRILSNAQCTNKICKLHETGTP